MKIRNFLCNKSILLDDFIFNKTSKYEYLTFNNCIECVFSVIGSDKQKYIIKCFTNELSSLYIYVYDEHLNKIQKVEAYGKICKDHNEQFYFALDRIGNTNKSYKKLGFGTLMMQVLIKVLKLYESINNIQFSYIHGILGIYADDNPKKSIPFYKSFNHYKFDQNRNLYLDKKVLNVIDREIIYLIA